MPKQKKQKKQALEDIDYSLTEFDYDGPVDEKEYTEEEENYEIDYDADDDYDDE